MASSTRTSLLRRAILAAAVAISTLVPVLAPTAASADEGSAVGTVRRAAGADRIETAILMSRMGWERSDQVVLARADDPADALSGSALAGKLDAPLLLTRREGLPDNVRDELRRLGATRVRILGGTAAVPHAVAQDVLDLGIEAWRHAGADRGATAFEVARQLGVEPGSTAVVVGTWQDALSAAGLVARAGARGETMPVLLSSPGGLYEGTIDAIRSMDIERVTVVGSEAVVPAAAVRQLRDLGAAVTRVAGPDRYATSLAVMATDTDSDRAIVATGRDFPDGLGAGALAARLDALLLLAPSNGDVAAQASALAVRGVRELVVSGGSAAISDDVAADLGSGVDAVEAPSDPGPAPAPAPDPSPSPAPGPSSPPSSGPVPLPGVASDIGPRAVARTRCEGIDIRAGQDWDPILAAHGPGTTYCIGAGTHREVQVIPQHGDRFIGAGRDRTIVTGARDLTGLDWKRSGARWYVDGQTQQAPRLSNCYGAYCKMIPGANARHLWGEELFVNDRRWDETTSLGALDRSGEWYFDYSANRIWIATDPADLTDIETSVSWGAFGGNGIRDVLIADMTLTKYATHPQFGAIGFLYQNATFDWTVRNVNATHNAGGGIAYGPGMTIDGCTVTDNGQIGITGDGKDRRTGTDYQAPVTIRNCEIARSPVLDYDWNWEAGATKFKFTEGMTFTNNHVHSAPAGIWFDVYNGEALVANNLVEDTLYRGIFYEISYGPATITNNHVRNGGDARIDRFRNPSTWHGVYGINVSNSINVDVTDNIVENNGNPLVIKAQGRGNGVNTKTANIHFRHNTVTMRNERDNAGWVGVWGPNAGHDHNITWAHNTYRILDGSTRRFRHYYDGSYTTDWWKTNREPTATFTTR